MPNTLIFTRSRNAAAERAYRLIKKRLHFGAPFIINLFLRYVQAISGRCQVLCPRAGPLQAPLLD